MPEFSYRGVDRAGQKINGKLEATNEGEVRMTLRGQGVRPTYIKVAGAGMNTDLSSMFKSQNPADITLGLTTLVIFTRQLHTLITSGIPLIQAIDVLQGQAEDKSMKIVLTTIKDKVAGGAFLWESLATFPRAFPKLYLALIRAGESSGAIDTMLKRLSRYLEDADRLAKMLKAAMFYPIMVILIGIGVVAALLIFVIPKFKELLVQGGQTLPGPTQFVIDVSEFLQHNILFILAGIGVGYYLLKSFMRTPQGRSAIQKTAFRLPLFGQIAQKGAVARFTRTLGTLLSSGVNLLDALDICKQTLDNVVIEDAMKLVRSEVETGKTLSGTIGRIPVFPRMAVQMIMVGENTGNLDKMLEKVADFYEQEVENLVGGITKLIEPFILVFLGGTVGFILIAMYLPIFKLAGAADG